MSFVKELVQVKYNVAYIPVSLLFVINISQLFINIGNFLFLIPPKLDTISY